MINYWDIFSNFYRRISSHWVIFIVRLCRVVFTVYVFLQNCLRVPGYLKITNFGYPVPKTHSPTSLGFKMVKIVSTILPSPSSKGQVLVIGVSWPSGLAYRTQVLVLAAECGFESRPWHLCPWARHLTIIASLHPGVKWVPVRAELVD